MQKLCETTHIISHKDVIRNSIFYKIIILQIVIKHLFFKFIITAIIIHMLSCYMFKNFFAFFFYYTYLELLLLIDTLSYYRFIKLYMFFYSTFIHDISATFIFTFKNLMRVKLCIISLKRFPLNHF